MSPDEFWWLMDAKRPKKTWGNKYKYTESQMSQMYEEMIKEHEAVYGR
jgi:hypothetical protein